MKKLIVVVFCIIVVFFIYAITKDKEILYFKVSDYQYKNSDKKVINYLDSKNLLEDYVIYHNINNYRVIDLINDIKNNKKIKYNNKEYNINNLLVKSELIVLNIGHNDFLYYQSKDDGMYDYINEILNDFENLFILIRKNTKENIIMIFDYNIDIEYRNYLYERLKIKAEKYNINVIKADKLLKYVKSIY